jgi:SAM-dependent methyltransferase
VSTPFEIYGQLANSSQSSTVKAGRRNIQAAAERRIPADVSAKLEIAPTKSLLEIGCGPGAILGALAGDVATAVGQDHPAVVEEARKRCRGDVRFISGGFPETRISERFDCVLVYSVLHYLPDMASIMNFVDAATELLRPGGRLLLGDIPNKDKMARFKASEAGRAFDREWQLQADAERIQGDPLAVFNDVAMIGALDDEGVLAVLRRCRAKGLNAFVLPQPPGLPFGHTREDILIVRD